MRSKRGDNLGEITGLSIPDEDVAGWEQTLKNEGFEPDFIDLFLANLNKGRLNETIKKSVLGGLDVVRVAMDTILGLEEERIGRKMTKEEKRQFLKDYFNKLDSNNPKKD